jgi:hypothetical protein
MPSSATYPQVRSRGTYWISDWMGPRFSLNAVTKRKKSPPCRCRESKPGRPARRLVTILTELQRLKRYSCWNI